MVSRVRILIIGAGFSGLGIAVRLRRAGIEDFAIVDRHEGIGGTWWANTYPGCQCDIPSHLYSLSFDPNPDWTRTFSLQPDIQAYLADVARRHDLLDRIQLGVTVTAASWDEAAQRWRVQTTGPDYDAHVLVSAVGGLSEPAVPPLPGLERFKGTLFHSARWNHGHALEGERVAVIGTGASAIQFVPEIQPQVERLHVFQRTPPWVMPHTDRPIIGLERRLYRRAPALQRINRWGIYWAREANVPAFTRRPGVLRLGEAIVRAHMRRWVRDPELRRKLTPSYTMGCKRILLSNRWYRALVQPNVEVVTEAISEIRPRSIVTADGTERPVDAIVLGTGFQVIGYPMTRLIRGREGRRIADVWDGSMRAYRGTALAGFPNLFLLLGPNTGTGHTSVVFMSEAQIEHIVRCIRLMEERGAAEIEVRPEVERAYNDALQRRMPPTVWNSGGCRSWYLDPSGRNAVMWPDFTFRFRRRTVMLDPERAYALRA